MRQVLLTGVVRLGCLHCSLMLMATAANAFNGIQVNVDEFGNDILLDAANEPSIAVDPNDPSRIAIGWRQFDTIADSFRQAGVAYSADGGSTWSASVLDPGRFRSDPVLDFDAEGNFYYSSLNGGNAVDMFKSTDGGATWSNPIPAFGGDKQWFAIDRTAGIGRGNIYQHWNVRFTPFADTSFTRSIDGAASFEPALAGPTSHMQRGTMEVGPDGTLYLAGATLVNRGHLFSNSTNAQDPTQTPHFVSSLPLSLGGTNSSGGVNPDGGLGQVNIATDHSQSSSHGNVYILSSVNPTGADPLDVMFIRSTDQGDTWSEPIRVNNDSPDSNAYQWFGTMSVAPNGRIDAIWNDTRNDSTNSTSELFYAYSFDAGDTWLGNTALSDPFDQSLGYPSQDKLGDYYDMISDDSGAYLAYAATFNGGQDVYYLRIDSPPPPNAVLVPEPATPGLLAAAIVLSAFWSGRNLRRRAAWCVIRPTLPHTATCCIVVGVNLFVLSGSHGQTFFLDTFDDMNLEDNMPVTWSDVFGEDLDASSGDLVLTPTDRLLGFATTPDTYRDVSLQTRVRVLGEPFIDAGVVARNNRANSTYIASISSSEWLQAPSSLVISGYFDGSFEILTQTPTNLDPTETDVTIRFDVIGEMLTLTAWAEETNKQSISYADDRLQQGFIGVEYDNGITNFFFLDEPTSAAFRYFEASPPSAPLFGDFNDDGMVDGADLLAWQRGESPAPLSAADLAAWSGNFGTEEHISAASTIVPEPSSVPLVSFALAALVYRYRASRKSSQPDLRPALVIFGTALAMIAPIGRADAQVFPNDNDGLLDVGEAPGFPTNPAGATGRLELGSLGIEDLDGASLLTNLGLLDLGPNSLTSIEQSDFNGLTNLDTLQLNRNSIGSIESGAFDALTNLEWLHLGGNLLTTVAAGTFNEMPRLSRLTLYSNSIMSIEQGAFDGLPNLLSLHLGGNSIMSIERGYFSGLDNLQRFYLFGNSLVSIERGAFEGLVNLDELDLSANSLTSIEQDDFSGLANLRWLSLHGNLLTSVEQSDFRRLTNLQSLYLEDNALTSIEPGAFEGFKGLVTLNLSDNDLTQLDLTAAEFDNLSYPFHEGWNDAAGFRIDSDTITKLILDDAELSQDSFHVIVGQTTSVVDVSLVGLTFSNAYPSDLSQLLNISTLDHVAVNHSLFDMYPDELNAFASMDGNTLTVVPEPTFLALLFLVGPQLFIWRR